MHTSKEYDRLSHKWKAPFELKKIKKVQRAIREAERVPVETEDAVIYVHSPEKGVTIPAHPE